MAVLSGNYVTLKTGLPYFDESKDFVLVRQVDTTDFRTAPDTKIVKNITGQTAKAITYRLTGNKAKNAKNLMVSLGLDRQYDVHGRIPHYKAINGVSDPITETLGDTELTFTPLEIGVRPAAWEWNYWVSCGRIYRFTGAEGVPYTADAGKWRMVPLDSDWSENIQYYYCENAGNWYTLESEGSTGDERKFLMFYLGRGILNAKDNSRISEYVLQAPKSVDNDDTTVGWWKYGTYVEGRLDLADLSPENGWADMYQGSVDTLNAFSYFDGRFNGYRNVGSTLSNYYVSGWKIDGAERTLWKNNCVQTVDIQNLTITQFGTLTDDGHTYFGVWVVEPEFKNFIGYNRIAQDSQADPPVINPVADVPSADRWKDLRDYGEFTDPVSRVGDFSRITFYGLEISELNIVPPIKDGPVPPPVNPYVPQGKDWPKLDPVFLNGRRTGLLSPADRSGFHVYRGTSASLYSLQKDFWNWGEVLSNIGQEFQENGKFNPLALLTVGVQIFQGVYQASKESKVDPLAAVQFIHNLPSFCLDASGTKTTIKVAGIDTGIEADCLIDDVIHYQKTISCSDLASTESYLDLSPWSTAEIYLPYIGSIPLDPADIIGGSITVHYNCCITSGVISAQIICENALANGYITEYGPYIGDAKFSIPISQKDQNAFNRELGYVKAMGTAMGGMVAGLGNSIKTLANANSLGDTVSGGLKTTAIMGAGSLLSAKQFVDSYLMKQQFRGTELGSGSAIVCPTESIYIMYTTPLPVYSDFTDSKRRGLTSGKFVTVGSARETGSKTLVKFNYIDLNNNALSGATQAEIDAIQTYMLGGVYI